MQPGDTSSTRRLSPEVYARAARALRNRVANERKAWHERWERDLKEAERMEALALDD